MEIMDTLNIQELPTLVKTYEISIRIRARIGILDSPQIRKDMTRVKVEEGAISALIKEYSTLPCYDYLFYKTAETAIISGEIRRIGLALSH